MTRAKHWVKIALRGVLILCGLIFGLVLVEVGLRITGIEYKTFSTIDEHRGWVDRPLVSGWYRNEGESYIQINSDGFRDREHTKRKPENTFRIALVGDSFVAAYEVPLEQGFAAVMERELNNNCTIGTEQKVEVIKFGVRGYGTAQELLTLQEKVWDYSPDVVLLAFYTRNDIVDNSRALSKQIKSKPELVSPKPYFIFQDGHLIFDASFVNTEAFRSKLSWWTQTYIKIEDRLRILQVLKHAQTSRKNSLRNQFTQARKPSIANKVDSPNFYYYKDYQLYKSPTNPEWQKAWQVTEELIKLMHNEVIVKAANFAVITLSGPLAVYPEPSERQKYAQASGIADWFYPEKRITALGKREGFNVLNLGPTFQAYAKQNNVCLHGFDKAFPCEGQGHWNSVGHQLAGKMIVSELCEQLNLEKASFSKVSRD